MNLTKEEIKVLTEEIIKGAEQVIFGNLKIFIDEVAPKLETRENLLTGLSAWLDISIKSCDSNKDNKVEVLSKNTSRETDISDTELKDLAKKLRDRTGFGLADCKVALIENNYDLDKAEIWLKDKLFCNANKGNFIHD